MPNQNDLGNIRNEARAQNLARVVERFVRTLNNRAGEEHAAAVIQDGHILDGEKIGQQPEWFLTEELIVPTAEVLGYELRLQPKGFDGLDGRIPDFTALNLEAENFGEVKKPGSIKTARKESVEYLDLAEERPLVGFATDGRTWILHTAVEGEEPTYTFHAPLHKLLKDVRMLETAEGTDEKRHPHLRELAMKFVSEFNIENVRNTVM
jgi:hypothetical protein